ncbi:zona pellucida-binding protein 2 [Melopsittacus undulatus]|uniref:zona pellucida-binding protein 2 n=1 Tax=Melopsittacus undulatus TaxID=13146 RepID=UPI00146A50CC|nr:zona pellucida-binding protein 2 [Melopsittacus undulatus]
MAGGTGSAHSGPGPILRLLAVLAALHGVGAEEEQRFVGLVEENYVYGNLKHEVNIYVKVFTNSPFLLCMDLARAQEELIDPNYLWIGPDGRRLEGQLHVNLLEPGKLMLLGFKESMSGAYTCALSHQVLETTTQKEREVSETYRFMVYAYREADHTYQVLTRFTTSKCELRANSLFFGELLRVLTNIISDLTCHITKSSYKCHSIRTPKQGLLHELFVRFQVNPFGQGWEEVCKQVPYDCEDVTNMRVQEARDRIEEFFQKQTGVLRHEFQTVPTIHYVENSFSVTPIDSCRPGFGKNNAKHRGCAGCCVVCEPGTYSPDNRVTCQVCLHPRVRMYGARLC